MNYFRGFFKEIASGILAAGILTCVALVLGGCQADYAGVLIQGDLPAARDNLDQRLAKHMFKEARAPKGQEPPPVTPQVVAWDKVSDLQLGLDRGMVALFESDPASAVGWWQQTKVEMSRRFIDDRVAASVTTLLDERAKRYSGLYHEYPLLPAFLAVSECVSGGRDTRAYVRQITDHERQIQQLSLSPLDDPPAKCFRPDGFSRFVAYAFNESVRSPDTELLMGKLTQTLGDEHPVVTAITAPGVPDQTRVYVVHLTGLAPPLERSTDLPVEAVKLAAAGLLVATEAFDIDKETVLGTALPPLPVRAVAPQDLVAASSVGLEVWVADPAGATRSAGLAPVVKMRDLLERYVNEARFAELTRGVVRRLVKAIAVEQAGKLAEASEKTKGFTLAILGFIEGADVRTWRLLPSEVRVGVETLDGPGEYRLGIGVQEVQIDAKPGGRWLVLAVSPGGMLEPAIHLGRLR